MSRVVVEFKTDGAAFRTDADDPGALDTGEVAYLLRGVADQIGDGRRGGPIVDTWGNVVGAFMIDEGDDALPVGTVVTYQPSHPAGAAPERGFVVETRPGDGGLVMVAYFTGPQAGKVCGTPRARLEVAS